MRFEPGWRPARRRSTLDLSVLILSGSLLGAAAGCFWLLYNVFGTSEMAAPPTAAEASATDGYAAASLRESYSAVAEVVRTNKSDMLARYGHPVVVSSNETEAVRAIQQMVRTTAPPGRPAPTYVTASLPAENRVQIPSYYAAVREAASTRPQPERGKDTKPLTRVAALEGMPAVPTAPIAPVVPRIPEGQTKTDLVSFQSAPFPHEGRSYTDNHVLLTVPPGFDANRPAVMIVFFHGHGATLARDVRDRQKLPDQIAASGMNAVLVAPQFAFDARDSNPGKFSDPGGFKRFLDEAALQLAKLHGDPRTIRTFANMPVVIVSYSGGFGPTLAVLDHGGVPKSRIRGIVLLDSLYSGIDRFANWITENRSGFFVSSYTPHLRAHNGELQSILRARSVPFGSELKPDHMAGNVTFLSAGPISHRDFVTHAWADNPVRDVLARLDEYDPRTQTAKNGPGGPVAAVAGPARN
ncbi:MAG: hypothetical protein JO228_03100 [Xanthobacteraceae bacterium]|nr:hypothetical protein [Xanthobacteraceae bacterium]